MAKKRRIGNEEHTEQEMKLESEEEEDLERLMEQISKQQLIEILRSATSEKTKTSEENHRPNLKQPVKENENHIDVSPWQMVVRRKSSSREETLQRKIFVGNVISHPEITCAKLHSFFSKYGEIEQGPYGFDKYTGKPKGFAFFMYKTVQGARKALEEPVKNFNGHPLYCERVHGAGSSDKLKHGSNSPSRNLPLKKNDGYNHGSNSLIRNLPLQNHEWNDAGSSSSIPRAGAGFSAQNGVMGHRGLSDQVGINGVVQPYRTIRKEPIQGHQLDNSHFNSEKLKYGSNGATRNLHLKNDACNHGGISPQACVGAGFNAQNWGMGHDQGDINGAAQRYARGKKPIQGHELDTPCRIGPSGHGQAKRSALARTGSF